MWTQEKRVNMNTLRYEEGAMPHGSLKENILSFHRGSHKSKQRLTPREARFLRYWKFHSKPRPNVNRGYSYGQNNRLAAALETSALRCASQCSIGSRL